MIEIVIVILFASALGSFGNNVISYFISGNGFDLNRSTCFCGEKKLKAIELIPALSFLFQRGKCTQCTKKIPIRYLFVELSSLVLGLIIFFNYGFSFQGLISFLIFYVLLLVSVIDYFKYIIPNKLTSVLIILVTIYLILNSEKILEKLLLSAIIFTVFLIIQFLFERLKGKEVIGMGDIKLIFVLCFLFEISDSLLAIWISSTIALITALTSQWFKKKSISAVKMPFGLFLSIGFFTVFILDIKYEFLPLQNLAELIWH
ncbi:MAG: prepilin peptidase [Ignavibacteriales bacterium]|nr:MAG: prepilin peptidase [Ignavibacteriales bacterium]